MADLLIASATTWDGHLPRNLGDEALTLALAQECERRGHRVRVSLAGAGGAGERVCVSRPAELVRAVRAADLVLLGGGTLLAGHVDGRRSVLPRGFPRFLAAVTAVAAACGTPVALVGVGAERWPEGPEDALLRWVVRRAGSVWVRDAASAELVARQGGRHARLGGDTFFAARLPVAVPRAVASGAPALPPLERAVEQVVVALSGRTTAQECAEVARRVAAYAPREVRVRRMDQHGDDDVAAQRVVCHLETAGVRTRLEPHVVDWRTAYAGLAAADLVVASRLHALVFAARAGVPAWAVGSSPKVLAFAAEAGVPLLGSGEPPCVATTAYLDAQRSRLAASLDDVLGVVG
ncbi:polysaccharide pyruvyl transferase family protein [Nocardioides solisilvae]|uniref:polysaccharide pyruvyl transferase family protein n=1 Tax=Nocardioides solisilvae TaxID=1542435 RepID=UPI0013A59947|nr:polysaccharide pyruvyl transferase family protein [Nocardioides solisilvae]